MCPQTSISLVYKPGNLGKSMCNYGMFISGRLVVPLGGPVQNRPYVLLEYHMDWVQSVGEWEGAEIRLRWKSSNILLTGGSKGT